MPAYADVGSAGFGKAEATQFLEKVQLLQR